MRYKDTIGREYACVSEVKEGDVLIADGGFVSGEEDTTFPLYEDEEGETYCIKPGSELVVKSGVNGLYVDCACGEHNLDGQSDTKPQCEDFYIGLYKKD